MHIPSSPRRSLTFFFALVPLALVLPACDAEIVFPDAGSAARDAALAADGGASSDAGATLDGGVHADAARVDDGGAAADGSAPDAGVTPDAGEAPDGCTPSAEHCNGVDDDCDGTVDEALVRTCGSMVGACMPGTATCSGGEFPMCVPAVAPSAETCDGVDEDCDGRTDESIAPRACGSDVGRCSTGTRTCTGGALAACMGQVGPRAERCDGIDDDCDGRTDESIAPVVCGSSVGTCRTGTRSCSGGALGACVGSVGPRAELDDGLDNDCDGTVDEGIPCESAIEGQQRALTNAERTSRGLPALSCDRALRRAARAHAQDMCRTGVFSHTSADGRMPVDRMRAAGAVFTRTGENIAYGAPPLTPSQVTAAWMASPSHRANILNAGFGRVGVGYATCSGEGYWVQDFAN
ncbi:MAG: CAP domain-containing protein [Sandaracinaceae bacterium]